MHDCDAGRQSGAFRLEAAARRGLALLSGSSSNSPPTQATRYAKAHDDHVASDRLDRVRGGYVRASGENKAARGGC